MRKCAKCGAEYADADFRTLCGYCMGNLAAASSAPAQAAPAGGPIQVGGPASESAARPTPIIPITITMPEIVVPDFSLPEVAPSPEMPVETGMPEPRPGPHPDPYKPPPLTPQPNPAIPQPPIIPLPQPEREPAVPSPVPQPVPQPFPQPAPTPQPVPQPMPQPTPQPVPQPRPVPRPEPGEPAPGASVGRALRPEELASARSAFTLYLVLGGTSGIIGFSLLNHPFTSFFKFIFLVLMWWLTYYFIRQALYRSAVSSVKIAPRGRLRLAEPQALEAVVTVIREVGVSNVEITLTGEERAVKGSGKSSVTYKHPFYTKTVRVHSPPKWPGGYEVLLAAVLPLPRSAPPSFAGRKNFIEWSADLWVGLAGLPDVRQRVPLTVAPARKEPPPPNANPAYRLPDLGPLDAQIGFTCPVDKANMPLFEVGREIPFTLRLNPKGDFGQQRVFVELSYMVTGSGDQENSVVARQSFPIAYWLDNTDRVQSGVLAIPPAVPITYQGTHLRIHWAVTVRHEQPWSRDHRQVFEVKVVPACEG